MENSTTQNNTHCIDLVRDQRRDWFLAAQFVLPPVREALYALYALDVELAHVHHVISEEMIGHIRYAWWQENIEAMSTRIPQGHPVFEALSAHKIDAALLIPIVENYREHFPNMPPDIETLVQHAARTLITQRAEASLPKWEKATATIVAHRAKYGPRRESWLLVKLLFV